MLPNSDSTPPGSRTRGVVPAISAGLQVAVEAGRRRHVADVLPVAEAPDLQHHGSAAARAKSEAIEAVSAKQETWTRSDLIREIDERLPANLGMTAERIEAMLERLADDALELVTSTRPRPEEGEAPLPRSPAARERQLGVRRPVLGAVRRRRAARRRA